MSSILTLPNEIISIVIAYTPTKELSRLSATSRFFHTITDPILMHQVQQDHKGVPALHWAAKHGYTSLIPRLLALGHNVDSEQNTTGEHIGAPIIHAARHNHLPAVNILLLHGANPNAAAANGTTALFYAACNNDVQMTTTLLKHSANANTKCRGHLESPLHWGTRCVRDSRAVLGELLRAGAEIDSVDSVGDTALHLACQHDSIGCLDKAKWLISNGASVNKVNNYGWTPLDTAIDRSAYSVARLLRENGAICGK